MALTNISNPDSGRQLFTLKYSTKFHKILILWTMDLA
jgi:hypothetical protein